MISAKRANWHLGVTLGSLSYLVTGILSMVLEAWWILLIGWALSLVIRRVFGDPYRLK
jgi:hypothetical protein